MSAALWFFGFWGQGAPMAVPQFVSRGYRFRLGERLHPERGPVKRVNEVKRVEFLCGPALGADTIAAVEVDPYPAPLTVDGLQVMSGGKAFRATLSGGALGREHDVRFRITTQGGSVLEAALPVVVE
jgi:hypothetical protein